VDTHLLFQRTRPPPLDDLKILNVQCPCGLPAWKATRKVLELATLAQDPLFPTNLPFIQALAACLPWFWTSIVLLVQMSQASPLPSPCGRQADRVIVPQITELMLASTSALRRIQTPALLPLWVCCFEDAALSVPYRGLGISNFIGCVNSKFVAEAAEMPQHGILGLH
jgi:hypothetical protein